MRSDLSGASLLLVCIIGAHLAASSIEFGDVRTILRLNDSFPCINETSGLISTVLQDTTQPERFIVGTRTALFTVNLLTQDFAPLELMVGDVTENGYREGEGTESRFNGISSVIQTEQGLIIADRYNHCLRHIELPGNGKNHTWVTLTYAGACKKQGSFNGAKSHASFSRPSGLLKQGNKLYIADSYNKRIRLLDMDSEQVTTIHQSQKLEMYQLAFGELKNEFFATVKHGIIQIKNGGERWLAGSESSKIRIANTQFTNTNFASPSAVVRLSDNLLLATDNRANCLKLIDLQRLEVGPIGAGWGAEDGSIQMSRFKRPNALTVVGDKILIGEETQVRLLPFYLKGNSGMVCEEPPMITNAQHSPLASYPEGATVYYKCADSHTSNMATNHLVCSKTDSGMVWVGGQIQCRLSNTTVAVIVLAPICAIGCIALGTLTTKLKKTNGRKLKLKMEILEMKESLTSLQTYLGIYTTLPASRAIYTLPQRPPPPSANDYYEPLRSVLADPPYYVDVIESESVHTEETSSIEEDPTN